ncbi:TPA: hypothetical protein TUV09_000803 [Streptococcus equi subsp. zooepidemicus]|nr:hypothetical protein [Streptococcus equi subsp. zooepidemicus]
MKKSYGIGLGLLLGSAAIAVTYLSLSSAKKKELLKEGSKTIEKLNHYIQEKGEQLIETASDKVEASKVAANACSNSAAKAIKGILEEAIKI